MSFPTPTPPPPRFTIGDRVTAAQSPGACGKIVGRETEDVSGTLWRIEWDDGSTGVLADQALDACGS